MASFSGWACAISTEAGPSTSGKPRATRLSQDHSPEMQSSEMLRLTLCGPNKTIPVTVHPYASHFCHHCA